MIVHDLISGRMVDRNKENNEAWKLRHVGQEPRLFPSALGGCERKAVLDATNYPGAARAEESHPYQDDLLRLFELGNEEELKSFVTLKEALGDNVQQNVEVGNDLWRARIDFLVSPCEQFPQGAIIEHKGTKWTSFKTKWLPREQYVYQALAYQYLYEEEHGITLPTYIYIRCWTEWAEYQVWNRYSDSQPWIVWDGQVNGEEDYGEMEHTTIQDVMARYEQWPLYDSVLPPTYETPFTERFACTKFLRRGSNARVINCPWFGTCWPDYPQDGILHSEE